MGLILPPNGNERARQGVGTSPISEVCINIFQRHEQAAWREVEGGKLVVAYPATVAHEEHELPLCQHQSFDGREIKVLKFRLHPAEGEVREVRLPAMQERQLARVLSEGLPQDDFNCITFVSRMWGIQQSTFKNLSPSDWAFDLSSPDAVLTSGEPILMAHRDTHESPVPRVSEMKRTHAAIHLAHGLTLSCFGNTNESDLGTDLIIASVGELMHGYESNVMWRMQVKGTVPPVS